MNHPTKEKELDDAQRNLRFFATRDASVVLEILKAYPHLAQEVTFPCDCPCNNQHGRHSLLAQLISCHDASASTIQQVTQLHPDAPLYHHHQAFCGPLHVACAHKITNNAAMMIDYLVHLDPQAVTTPDAHGNLPLHYALSHSQVPLETIQLLVETACKNNPQTITTPNLKGETPLSNAIWNACHDNDQEDVIIPYLVGKLHSTVVDYEFGYQNNTTLNVKRCQALIHLLPKLNTLVCRPCQWTWDALFLLLSTLSTNNSITKLVLEGIPRAFLTTHSKMKSALQQLLLTNNTNLEQVHLEICNTWHDKNRKADQQCLENLVTTLSLLQSSRQGQEMPRVSLSLISFQLYQSRFATFLQQAQPLITSLSLYACTVLEEEDAAANSHSVTQLQHHHGHSNIVSLLERFELVHCRMAPFILQDLLVQIQQTMPRIQHLKLVFREEMIIIVGGEPFFDLTKFVQEMLYNNNNAPSAAYTTTATMNTSSLQSLTIEGLHVDCQLLKHYATTTTNTGNTSAGSTTRTMIARCYIQYSQFGQVWRNIQYATALNRFGRRHCQDEERATKVSLVEYLQELEVFDEMDDMYKTVVRYGVLKECPSLWAS